MKQTRGLLRVLLVTALGYVPVVNAALLIESFTPSSVQLGQYGGYTYGLEFTVNAPMVLTQLAAFASTASGPFGMRVALWEKDNPIALVDASVLRVNTNEGWNWKFVDVADQQLLTTKTYRIAAETLQGTETQAATVAWGNSPPTVGSGITVSPGYVMSSSQGFSYPGQQFTGGGIFAAANAQIVPIPEPSSFALLALGLAGLWIARRRLG